MTKKKTLEQQLKEVENMRDKILAQMEKKISKGMKYCMVRTHSAGVFAGFLYRHNGKEVVLKDARRIWYWEGAASLSELAVRGTSAPNKCKFPVAVPEVTLTETIEIIPITDKAKKSIESVPVWSK